jgi:uncharacterized protein YecT (DUF1311 family)
MRGALAVAFVLFGTAAYAEEIPIYPMEPVCSATCAAQGPGPETDKCFLKLADDAEHLMSLVYTSLNNNLHSSAKMSMMGSTAEAGERFAKDLDESQRDWLSHRNTTCILELEFNFGGPVGKASQAMCLCMANYDRLNALIRLNSHFEE